MKVNLDLLVKRSLEIPAIRINRMKKEKVFLFEAEVFPEHLKITKKTLDDHYLDIPVHDDSDYLEKNQVLQGGNKFINYRFTRRPLGIFDIEIEGGFKVLKSGDTRYLSKDNVKKQRYSFVFDEEKGAFYEFVEGKLNDPNALIAQERVEQTAAFRKAYLLELFKLISFLRNVKSYPALSFPFTTEQLDAYFANYRLFFEKAHTYIKIQLVFGAISKSEYLALKDRLAKLELEGENLANSPLIKTGPEELVIKAGLFSDDVRAFVVPRNEDVKGSYNVLQEKYDAALSPEEKRAILTSSIKRMGGYFLCESLCCPTLLEIERRKNQTTEHNSLESEQKLEFLIQTYLQ